MAAALIILGALLLIVGAGLWYVPAGLMVAGVIFLAFGVDMAPDVPLKKALARQQEAEQ